MNKKKIEIPAFFPFWKDNLVKNLFTLEPAKLERKFREYLNAKALDWIEYYGSRQCIAAFITDTEDNNGLQSTFDNEQLPAIEAVLQPVYMEYLRTTENPK
jgi:hypothetical protein